MEHSVSGVGVLDKVVLVLDALADGPLPLSGLVDATGLSRATAHRMAAALEVHGLLRRDDHRRYVLGWRLVSLGRSAESEAAIVALALPVLEELRDACGESAQLYVRDGNERVCIAALDSPDELRTVVLPGARLALDRGSAGAALTGECGDDGWNASVGERAAGVASVSASVRDRDGAIVAAISVSGPIERTTTTPGERYGKSVVAAAKSLEELLG